ncbi:MAG: hypothetical protein GY757_06175, partial [bacterium]|nr:hypothetical protein [bacterium]
MVQIIRVIESTLSGRGDLCFDGEKLWKSGYSILYAVDMETGTVIRSHTTVPGSGVAFFEDRLYLSGEGSENILHVIDPLSGDLLNKVSTTGIYPGYLAASDDGLLIYDTRSAGIFHYQPETGESRRLFEASGINIGGIASYKGGLLISDANTDTVYNF